MKTFLILGMLAFGVYAASPPIDMSAIHNDPLESETTSREVNDGIVVEHVTFNGDRDLEGAFIRLSGILVYPEGGVNLPGLLWCQGGMGDAATYFPTLFARKGYACIHISLAKKTWSPYARFDTDNPQNANLLRFGIEQLRAVTYLANRPEVDAGKLGVAGASYGGLFSSFVAGVDERIKCGMSFFAAGNHHLGSNLPQFTKLESLEEIEVWKRTFDPATWLRQRDIPFIWGLPTNDNWFYFPAVVETYREKPGEKRIAILPHWVHGFPPELDQQLFDWADIWLKGTRKPYLKASELAVTREDGKLIAAWQWTGEPAARRAELIVSWGRVLPWHGWRHRYYHTLQAERDGASARAEIPVPDPDLPLLVFGNVYDEHDVLISTNPVVLTPRDLGLSAATGYPVTNGAPRGQLEAEDTAILQGTAQGFGRPDATTFHSGTQSVALEAGKKPKRHRHEVQVMLYNVYEQDHRLAVWLKADQPMTVNIEVVAQYPANWETPAAQAILAAMPEAAAMPEKDAMPRVSLAAALSTEWQVFTMEVPFTGVAVEGYNLVIDRNAGESGTYWIDDIRFETQWRQDADRD